MPWLLPVPRTFANQCDSFGIVRFLRAHPRIPGKINWQAILAIVALSKRDLLSEDAAHW